MENNAEPQALQSVRASGEFHACARHVEDIRSACGVQHVRAP
jgi:hypothetical protein